VKFGPLSISNLTSSHLRKGLIAYIFVGKAKPLPSWRPRSCDPLSFLCPSLMIQTVGFFRGENRESQTINITRPVGEHRSQSLSNVAKSDRTQCVNQTGCRLAV
jgi:hypothetical protein